MNLGKWLNRLFASAQPASADKRAVTPARCLIRLMFALSLVMVGGLVSRGEMLGHCRFDSDTLSFSGTPKEQAQCLLRPVGKFGHVGADPEMLPNNLDRLIGNQ